MITDFAGDGTLDQAVADLQQIGQGGADQGSKVTSVINALFSLVPRMYTEIKVWAVMIVAVVRDQSTKITGIQQSLDTADQTFTKNNDEMKNKIKEIERDQRRRRRKTSNFIYVLFIC